MTLLTNLNPAWLLMIASILIPVIFRLRSMASVAYVIITILTLIWIMAMGGNSYAKEITIFGQLSFSVFSTYVSRIFAIAFMLMLLMSIIYTMNNTTRLEISSAMFSAGASLGVVFSGDLVTLSLYWQLIAVSSTLLLWSKRTIESRRSAKKYLLLHLVGGLLMFMGIMLMPKNIKLANDIFNHLVFDLPIQGLAVSTFTQHIYDGNFGVILVLIGTLLSVGCPPFTRWISETYPEASPSGSVFLSGFMTKTGIYVLLILFSGLHFLIYLGVFMILYGAVYSLLSSDHRKSLSYLIVNQTGFMVVCVGIGTRLSLNAVCFLVFANVIYSALLYMGFGLVAKASKDEKATNLGIFRFMPFEFICTLIGGLAISMFPLTSGFIAKSLMITAINELGVQWLYVLVLVGIVGVFASVVVRLIYGVIHAPLEKNPKTIKTPKNVKIAMGLLALITILMGIFPTPIYRFLSYSPKSFTFHVAYHFHNVVATLELLAFTGFIFVFLLKSTKLFTSKEDRNLLDFDWIWTKGLRGIAYLIIAIYESIYNYINRYIVKFVYKLLDTILTNLSKPHVSGSVWNAKATAVVPIVMILIMLILFIFTHTL